MLTGSGVELLDTAAGSPDRTTSASTAPATRAAWPAQRSRCRAGSTRSPTRSTRSPPSASTGRGQRRAAVETLRAERERHFDPRVVDAFVEALDDALEIRRALRSRRRREPAAERPEDAQLTLQAARERARDPAQPAAALGRRGPDRGGPHARRATATSPRRRAPARSRERRAARRARRSSRRPGRCRPAETCCAVHGRQITAAAAAAIYRDGPPGWFASEAAGRGAGADGSTRDSRPAASRALARRAQATGSADAAAHTLHAASLARSASAFLERRERRARPAAPASARTASTEAASSGMRHAVGLSSRLAAPERSPRRFPV